MVSTDPGARRQTGRRRRGAAPTDVENRIIEATLALMREDGVTGLTTVAIARRAGIHQPNFYAYYPNIDACLVAAARRIADHLRRVDTASFRNVRHAVERGEPHMEENVAYHAALLDLLLEEPRWSELYFRHKNDASAYGAELRRVEQEFVDKTVEHLWDWGIRLGLGGRHLPDVRLLAEVQVASVAAAVVALLEGRAKDRGAVARMLAHNADATTRVTFRRLMAEERSGT